MAQNLVDISQESFQMQINVMSIDALKRLIKEIYDWKMDKKNKLNPEDICDMSLIINIERKETKVMNELQRRGYLKKEDYNQFYDWLATLNKKKVVF